MLTYNHWDSGPEWLGKKLMQEIRTADATVLREVSSRLQIVESEKRPTKKQLEGCYMYLRQEVEGAGRLETYEEMVLRLDDRNVGGPGRHWYKVLRQTQGTFSYVLAGLPFFIGNAYFPHQSDCEWAYIVNLDTNQFEIYTGHWTPSRAARDYYPVLKPQGRYAKGENGEVEDGWGGVLLIEAIALDELADASDEAITRYCKRLDRAY
jgi:hypothetical protein